jgi:uncharacterized protein
MARSSDYRGKKVAVAVFVKTPGKSPLKTRLAKTIGEESAHEFYTLACKTLAATLRNAATLSQGRIHPVWAVAEHDTQKYWTDFPVIWQGDGELGDKLHTVYSSLLASHDGVMLIGADAPHLTPEEFIGVLDRHLEGADFVVGPAKDGGFYLFSGTKPVPERIWKETRYSSDDTLQQLLPEIKKNGATEILPVRTDVDVFEDLRGMLNENADALAKSTVNPELFAFVRALIDAHS